MKQKPKATTRDEGSRPLKILAVGIAFTATVLAIIGWHAWSTHRAITNLVTDDLRLQELRGTILQFDEVLTMSARMAAATGDYSWEERYRLFEPVLDTSIKEAIELAPEVYQSEAAAQTDEANLKLVEMENRAFKFVQQDKCDAATQLLFSEEYERQKEAYADGMKKLDTALGDYVEGQIESYRGRVLWMGMLGLVAVIVLVLGWIAVFVAVQTHLKKRMPAEEALENAHRDLEFRVEERTNELAQANRDLKTENGERHQAEEALQKAKDYTDNIIRSMIDMLLVVSPDGEIRTVNDATCNVLGYRGEELTGQPATLLFAEEEEKEEDTTDLIISQKALPLRRRVLRLLAKEGFASDIEKSFLTRSGQKIPVLMSGSVMRDNDGRIRGIVCVAQDITERKRAEEELRRLAMIAEQAGEGIAVANLDGVLQFVNVAWARMHGYETGDELVGKHLSVFHTDEQMQTDVTPFNEEVKRTGYHTGEVGHVRRDGRQFPTEMAVTLLRDERAEPRGLIGFATDITARKRAEEQLRLQSGALAAAANAIMITDQDGCIVWVNPAFANLTGYQCDEAVGQNPRVLKSGKHDDAFYRDLWDTVLAGKVWQGEMVNRRKGGSLYTEEMTITPVRDEHGEITHFITIKQDVSERRLAQEQLQEAHTEIRQLLEAISSVLISVDVNDRVTAWNAVAEGVFGIAAEQAVGQLLHDLEIKWDHAAVVRGMSECGTKNRPVRIDEIRFVRPDGADGFLGITLNPVNGSPDNRCGFLLIASDTTEQKILQGQLTHAQKLESIGQLAAGIAHEINTPTQYVGDNTRFLQDSVHDLIKIVDQYAELLNADKGPRSWDERLAEINAVREEVDIEFLKEEIPKAIEQSLEGVDRVAKIVRSMKDFSHPGGDEKQAVDLNKAIESTVTVARNEWKYVAEMVTDFDAALPLVPCLLGDFNQVILNMIINAAHAITDVVGKDSGEKGTITVSTRQDGAWAEIRVSDTGSGIPEEIRSKVFDPFFTTKDVGKGSGQGLAIAHTTVVNKHGGELSVESEVGQATTFIIRLPVEAEPGPSAGTECHEEAYSLR